MLTSYIVAAMRRAQYEILDDQPPTFYASIPGLQGVWANKATLEACREELQSALEDWIIFGLQHNLPIPPLDDIDLIRPMEQLQEAA